MDNFLVICQAILKCFSLDLFCQLNEKKKKIIFYFAMEQWLAFRFTKHQLRKEILTGCFNLVSLHQTKHLSGSRPL